MDRDHVVVPQLIARNVHAPAVDRPVPVQDQLPRLPSTRRKSQPDEYVVEAALEHAQKVLAGDARLLGGLLVVDPELLLEHAVVALGLLLLAQLDAVLALAHPAPAMLAGRV